MTTDEKRCAVCGAPIANHPATPRTEAAGVWQEAQRRLREAEQEAERLRTIIRVARERLYDAHGRGPETVATVIRAVGQILRRADEGEKS